MCGSELKKVFGSILIKKVVSNQMGRIKMDQWSKLRGMDGVHHNLFDKSVRPVV